MTRANRVAIAKTEVGFEATFFKTHDMVGKVTSEELGFKAKAITNSAIREEFRALVIKKADKLGINWSPELQQQAWERKFWKYETDSQVETDATELMWWTIQDLATKCKYKAELDTIILDSIVPNASNLSYVDGGKYLKNGNWASATVNLEVRVTINKVLIDIIYSIEMVSGQLKKIKLTKGEIDAMIDDTGIVVA